MSSKFVAVFFVAMLLSFQLSAQFTDRYWTFGDSAGINFKNLTNPVAGESILRVRGACVSICDSLGDLLFYGGTPNLAIWRAPNPPYTYDMGFIVNKNHQKIVNGDSLKCTYWYHDMLITPNPANINQFYVFTAGETNSPPLPSGLYYNLLDLSLNNGDGYVIQKNVQLQSFTVADCMTAIKHGNGRDWWVIIRDWSPTVPKNSFYVYLVSPIGITLFNQQNIGSAYINSVSQRLEFNPSGEKLYSCNAGGLIERFDFDRCSGTISNNTVLAPFATTWRRDYWSMALSPDDSKLYLSTLLINSDTTYLVQYDLNAPNFLASSDTLLRLAADDNEQLGLLQPGPDGKIYLSAIGNSLDCGFDYLYCDTTWNLVNSNISVINYPDSLGAACDFQPFSFNLGGHRAYVGLPNNPNYELGALIGSPCDTLTVGITEKIGYKNNITVYFDVNWQTAFINAKGLRGKKFTFELYNINGQLIQQQQGFLDSEYYTNNLSMVRYSEGIYVVRLKTDKEVLTSKFIKR